MSTPSEKAAARSAPESAAADKPKQDPARDTKAAAEKARGWHDAWVGAIAGDGAEIPSVVALFGYLSQAPEAGRVRLYFDPHLLRGVDLDVEEIVHREAAPTTFSPLGGSFVWIPSGVWAQATILYRQI